MIAMVATFAWRPAPENKIGTALPVGAVAEMVALVEVNGLISTGGVPRCGATKGIALIQARRVEPENTPTVSPAVCTQLTVAGCGCFLVPVNAELENPAGAGS